VTRGDAERRWREARWPEPRAELRARVLAAAPVIDRRVTWSDRVWFSRVWRVAAAAAGAGAIAILSLPDAADSIRFDPTPQAMLEAQVVEDAGRDIGLPPSVAQALARRTLQADARGAAADHRRLTLQTLVAEGETK
jgi:hypothetical protein